jgi:hypothetical protein
MNDVWTPRAFGQADGIHKKWEIDNGYLAILEL